MALKFAGEKMTANPFYVYGISILLYLRITRANALVRIELMCLKHLSENFPMLMKLSCMKNDITMFRI